MILFPPMNKEPMKAYIGGLLAASIIWSVVGVTVYAFVT